MKKSIVFWIEEYFYNPSIVQKILSILLLPLSYIYCFFSYLHYKNAIPEDLGVDVIGIGNLNVGGSGKTPLVTALAQHYEDVAVVLRGYARESKGLYVIKDKKDILHNVSVSGDEAMIYATKLTNAIVIVSEDRKKGILKAKAMGAKIVFLDDAYSKHSIKKLDLVIEVRTKNTHCLPSGAFREKLYKDKKVFLLQENKEFKRVVKLKDKNDKMSLVTAIARPKRLDSYLPEVLSKNYFEDHHIFTKSELEDILQKDKSTSLLVTYKDYVKIQHFDLPLSLLDLEIIVDEKIFQIIGNYIAKKD